MMSSIERALCPKHVRIELFVRCQMDFMLAIDKRIVLS
jgi:hypothetical protein